MKQLEKTSAIVDRLKASFGADVNVEDMAVFEAIALNNLPLRKRHPLFDGAVAQDSLLRDLVARINTESVPLQLMHDYGELPSGRVFDAMLNGQEVRVLIGLSKTVQADLVREMDQGIIDQVSVNLLAKQVLCSDCGWDYMGADAGFENILTATCANEHVLREGGVFAALHGLEHLAEISLVNTGGAQNARIQSRNNQVYAEPAFQRLAASGHSPALLLAELTPTIQQDALNMTELTELVASLTDEKAKGLNLTASLETATLALSAAETANEALTLALAGMTAERDALVAADPIDTPAEVVAFLSDICSRSMVALGDQTPLVPTDVNALMAGITAAQAKLSAIFPVGGVSLGAIDETNSDTKPGGFAPSAFRVAN